MYWVDDFAPLQLALMPRPRGGALLEADVRHFAAEGVTRLVSLLEDEEMVAAGLEAEPDSCMLHGIEFHRYPIPDHGTPACMDAFTAFIDALVPSLTAREPIAIHCMAGIGRSSLTAAALLLRQGQPLRTIFPCLSRARGLGVPETTEQALWFREFARRCAAAGQERSAPTT